MALVLARAPRMLLFVSAGVLTTSTLGYVMSTALDTRNPYQMYDTAEEDARVDAYYQRQTTKYTRAGAVVGGVLGFLSSLL